MVNKKVNVLSGVIVEENDETMSLADLCQHCSLPAEKVITMIDVGIIEPLEPQNISSRWRFSGESVLLVQTALRLQRDLEVNLSGAVLALELLNEIKELRQLVASLKRH